MSCIGQLEMETWDATLQLVFSVRLCERKTRCADPRFEKEFRGVEQLPYILGHQHGTSKRFVTVSFFDLTLWTNVLMIKKHFRLKMISRRSSSSGSRNKSFPRSQPQSSSTWCPLEIQWEDERGEIATHITPNQHLPKYVSLLDKGLYPQNSILFPCSIRRKLRKNNPKEDLSYQKLNLPGPNRDGSSTAGASWPTRQKGEESIFVLNIISMSMSIKTYYSWLIANGVMRILSFFFVQIGDLEDYIDNMLIRILEVIQILHMCPRRLILICINYQLRTLCQL